MLPCFQLTMLQTQRSITTRLSNPFFPLKFPKFPATQTRQLTAHSSLLYFCRMPEHLQQIHARFILHGLHQNPSLSSKLIDSYANLGLLYLSKQIFNSLSTPTTVCYNTILRNLANYGEFENILFVYKKMALESMYPDEETYPFVLGSCSYLLDVKNGKKTHGHLVKLGFDSCYLVGTALLDMYRSFIDIANEGKVIEKIFVKDVNYWNSLLFEASQNGNAKESFRLYERMTMEMIEPDSVTVINLLRCCVDLGSLRAARAIHLVAFMNGLCKNLSVNTALLSMYSKFGAMDDARILFEKMPEKDGVVWNIMISAYLQNGYPNKSIELLRNMAKSGVRTDLFTAIPVLSSIRQLKSIKWGKEMHAHVVRNGSDYQVSVHNSLIDMYCENDCLNYARKIFDSVADKTAVSWSSMIKGYVNHDLSLEALSLFSKMKVDGPRVDFIMVINILPACVSIGALEQVKNLQGYSIKLGLNMLLSVNTALLVSYAKCGCIELARKLFDDEEISKDIITWNSMINAHANHGDWFQCFKLYSQMKQSCLEPDEVTFLGLLTACVNSGFVKVGWEIFVEMMKTTTCKPRQEHYACMVDLLGRAGHVYEATEIVKSMPFKPDARVWGPLLSACKIHSDTKYAEFAAENLINLEPSNAGNYILLSNIYAAAGKWDGVAKMRSFLRDKGLKKTPGCSWLEINGCVHDFRIADQTHPKVNDIYTILRNLELEIKEARDNFEKTAFTVDFVDF